MKGRNRSHLFTLLLAAGVVMLFSAPSWAQNRHHRSKIYKGVYAPLLMDAQPFQYSPKLKRVVPVSSAKVHKPRSTRTRTHKRTTRRTRPTKPTTTATPTKPTTPKNIYRGSFSPLLMDGAEFRFNPKTGKVEEVY
jgi:hypothetical protein